MNLYRSRVILTRFVFMTFAFMTFAFMNSAFAQTTCNQFPNLEHFYSNGWGIDAGNNRYQADTTINRANVANLELAWVFALDDSQSPHSYPVVTDDTVFIGTTDGNLYALDRSNGCVRWQYEAGSQIRTGITHGKLKSGMTTLFFGTVGGFAHAVDAVNGESLWISDASDYPFSMLTGTPLYHDDRLYVPVSSGELGVAISPFYGCCKFRGSLVAMDAANGAIEWRTHTIAEAAQVTGSHYVFVEEWGPSGAPIWSAPTLDTARGLIYVGTGENYTQPASAMSDSIVAINLSDGAIRWAQQYTSGDAFNLACTVTMAHPNCPEDAGPDLDFGAPPIVSRTKSGKPIVLAGQKSGGVYGIDPDTGQRIWSAQLGRGGYLGGVHWGMATHPSLGLLFAPVSDVDVGPHDNSEPEPGLHALDITTGELKWSQPNPDRCSNRKLCRTGMSAAIVATEDLVFAGGLDGYLHAYDANTGDIVWSYDTWQTFDAVNRDSTDAPTLGGAIDVHGPLVAGDMVLVTSGYGSFGQKGGNALVAFRIAPKDTQ